MIGLPASEGFNAMWSVVDCQMEMSCNEHNGDEVDSKRPGDMYMKILFRPHGQPQTTEVHCRLQYASAWWPHVWKEVEIKHRWSKTFEPYTNYQTEKLNEVIEHYL
jgi:hypothetical protein